MDDDTAVGGPFGKIAVTPNIVEAVEIGRPVFLTRRIIPEADRHRGKRLRADQLSLATSQRAAVVVPHIDGHAEARPLNFALPHRQDRDAEHEAGYDVRAAGN